MSFDILEIFEMETIKIQSNWTVPSADKTLRQCLRIVEDGREFDPDSVKPENCVQLVKSDGNSNCQLSLELPPNQGFSQFNLASQSKRCEVFEGSSESPGAYLTTLTGTLLGKTSASKDSSHCLNHCSFGFSDDSDEELVVFSIQGSLKSLSSTNKVSLKLTGVQESCWILGIEVSIVPLKPNCDRFNLSKLNSVLDEGGELSDKAKDFKMLFETFQKSKPPSMMMAMQKPTLNNTEIFQSMTKTVEQSKPEVDIDQCQHCGKRFDALERRIQELEARQNEKLDRILSLMTAGVSLMQGQS